MYLHIFLFNNCYFIQEIVFILFLSSQILVNTVQISSHFCLRDLLIPLLRVDKHHLVYQGLTMH